ncbi:MAG: hypothetical protein ICV72_10175, partial [Aldersonia sp.]|nr:hypothetical protein [Aldersonia sp.]
SPQLLDWWQLRNDSGARDQRGDEPDSGQDNLERSVGDEGRVSGRFGSQSKASSIYTEVFELHPRRKSAAMVAAVAGALIAARRIGR